MFSENKKARKEASSPSKEQNKISQGTTFKGDIQAQGGFRVEGTLEGTLITTGKVVIGKSGIIKGEMKCENADVEGSFSGKLKVNSALLLKSTAQIDGEVITGKLSIEPGADFNATCAMKSSVKNLNDDKRSKEKQGKTA
ncbi:polymer-forming cytoskeletal protein [Mesonia sp. MT50]|uniref:Polymer-forming cytoskeletal protein n=1 Tax=Mesonia profundi TaxID=3070998 RepID=A0ABU0ZYM5_9FLAO|nr:polymer-forming cytoskeletal protein [Mesonia profundi]MDQ7916567.1 polymer-forming cytoskeletal protein [Mesonia profundi]